MGLNNFGLGFTISAKDNASRAFDKVGRSFVNMEKKSAASVAKMKAARSSFVAGATLAAAGSAALFGGVKLANAAGVFEENLTEAGAIMRTTSTELKLLEGAATQAGIATQFSPTEAIEGLTALGQRGNSAKKSIELLNPVLDFAAAGKLGVGEAAEIAGTAMSVFGIDAKGAGLAMDKMIKSSNTSALKSEDLATAMGGIGKGAIAAKQNLTEMLVTLGLVKNAGVPIAVATNSTSVALTKMAKNAAKFQKDLNVSVGDGNGGFRDFLDIVQDTSVALETQFSSAVERTAKITELFGDRGKTSFLAIQKQLTNGIEVNGKLLKGKEAIKQLRLESNLASGTMEKFKNQLLDTFSGSKRLLSGTLQTLAIGLGKGFAKVLKPIVRGVAVVLNKLFEMFNNLPEGFKTFISGAVLLGGVLATLAGGFVMVKAAMVIMAPTIAAFKAGMLGLSTTLAPIAVPVLAAVAALGLLVVLAKNDVGGLGTFLSEKFEKVKLVFSGIQQILTDGFFSGDTANALLDSDNEGTLDFLMSLGQAFEVVSDLFSGFSDGFMEVFAGDETVQDLLKTFKELGNTLSDTFALMGITTDGLTDFKSIGAAIGVVVGGAFKAVIFVIKKMVQVIVFINTAVWGLINVFLAVGKALKSVISTAFDGLLLTIMSVLQGIVQAAKAILPKSLQPAFLDDAERNLNTGIAHEKSKLQASTVGKDAKNVLNTAGSSIVGTLNSGLGIFGADSKAKRPDLENAKVNSESLAVAREHLSLLKENSKKDVKLEVVLDGEKLATAVKKGEKAGAIRNLSPVGAN